MEDTGGQEENGRESEREAEVEKASHPAMQLCGSLSSMSLGSWTRGSPASINLQLWTWVSRHVHTWALCQVCEEETTFP